jgi:two-component system LytT family response regulator
MTTPIIRTLIADDERLAREKLRMLLESERCVEIVAESCNARETITAVRDFRPNLLLLDIQMPDADGFEVLRQIPNDMMPIVIFSTAYEQYGVRAFEVHAMDYLMKPFDRGRVHDALERVRAEFIRNDERHLAGHLRTLISSDWHRQEEKTLVIKTGGRFVFIDPDEIDWVEAAANYVKVIVGKASYVLRGQIGRFAERLDSSRFVRIHRCTIVNVKRIKELHSCENGEYIAVLKTGKELSCGRSYRNQVQALLERKL